MARGHLRKRSDDSWTLVIELGRDPATGKRQQKWVTVQGTKKEAESRLAELLVEAERGTLAASPRVTVGDFLERWLADYAESNTSPKTYLRYRERIAKHVVPHLGKVPLAKLQPTHLLRLQSILRDLKRVDGVTPALSPTTRRHVHRVLHTAFGHAVKWKLIPTNPAAAVDAPAPHHREMQTFAPEQAVAFLAASREEGTRWEAFFAVSMTTGLRLGEMIGLRWQDVDLDTGTLVVRQTIQRLPKIGHLVKPPKTSGSRRPVALGPDVVALLRRHRVQQNEERLALGAEWKDHDLVFPSQVGTPLEDKAVRRAFVRTCRRAKVPLIPIHDLRHTSATLLLTAGINPKVVSERLGHSTIGITLQTYSHVSKTLQQAPAETLDALLRGRKERKDA